MQKKQVSVGSLKKGDTIVIDDHPCKVTSTQTSRPGKHGHAKVRLEAVGMIDGKKRVIVMPGHDKVDQPIIQKMSAQVLSVTGNAANVMDSETYETFDLEIPSELQNEVVEGANILYWQILQFKVLKQVKTQ